MLKVFLVDDEIIVRESIRSTIDWEGTEYSLVGEAPDGEMALSMMMDLKPDILLTDIRMPFMDGLALASVIKKNMPWIRIIILSGHDEFEYAKQAISLGVSAYLLKPIGPEELMSALDNVAAEINDERAKMHNLEAMKKQLESSAATRSEKLLEDLIMGTMSTAEAIDLSRNQGVNLLARNYLVMTFVVQSKAAGEIDADRCTQTEKLMRVKSYLQSAVNMQTEIIYYFSSMNRFTLLLKGDEGETLEERSYILAQGLRHKIENEIDCKVTIAIGTVVERVAEIRLSYNEADQVLHQLGGIGSGKTYSAKDLTIPKDTSLKQLSSQDLGDKIKYAIRADIPKIVEAHFSAIGEQSLRSLLLSYYILMDVLVVSSRLIEEYGGKSAEIIPESLHPDQMTLIASSREQLFAKICDILDRTLEYRDSKLNSRYADLINKACAYIEENYNRTDLALNQVAAHVALSNNHFCTIFAQETGQTFIEYLTDLRIKQAQKLLRTTQLLSSEIAYKIGYNDPHYFSYIFKKNTGIPPREYRLKHARVEK